MYVHTYIRTSYIFALLQLAVCRCWANQCRCCCRCGKFRSGMSLPFEGTGRDSIRSFCQYIPILRSRRNMQSAGKMRGRRATATRRERCQRCGRQGEGRAEDRIKGEGGRRGRENDANAIIDAECAIVDEVHSQPRSVSALDVTRMHVPVAH